MCDPHPPTEGEKRRGFKASPMMDCWSEGRGPHGERLVVGVPRAQGSMSHERAQEIADDVVFALCYGDDLAAPEEEVFS